MRSLIAIAVGSILGFMAGGALEGAGLAAQCLASFLVSMVSTFIVLEALS